MVAEGEELETNLLQASQRIPASSGVLDEVFGTPTRFKSSCFRNPRKRRNIVVSRVFSHNEQHSHWLEANIGVP